MRCFSLKVIDTIFVDEGVVTNDSDRQRFRAGRSFVGRPSHQLFEQADNLALRFRFRDLRSSR